ncbi:MAG: hypothetical protein ACFFD8_04255 [Candidatus Thorarchaeota archaeon]
MVRYILNKCKVPVSEDQRAKEPDGLRECHNPKSMRRVGYEQALLSRR